MFSGPVRSLHGKGGASGAWRFRRHQVGAVHGKGGSSGACLCGALYGGEGEMGDARPSSLLVARRRIKNENGRLMLEHVCACGRVCRACAMHACRLLVLFIRRKRPTPPPTAGHNLPTLACLHFIRRPHTHSSSQGNEWPMRSRPHATCQSS